MGSTCGAIKNIKNAVAKKRNDTGDKNVTQNIAILGSGFAGITAAQYLNEQQIVKNGQARVTLIDKQDTMVIGACIQYVLTDRYSVVHSWIRYYIIPNI